MTLTEQAEKILAKIDRLDEVERLKQSLAESHDQFDKLIQRFNNLEKKKDSLDPTKEIKTLQNKIFSLEDNVIQSLVRAHKWMECHDFLLNFIQKTFPALVIPSYQLPKVVESSDFSNQLTDMRKEIADLKTRLASALSTIKYNTLRLDCNCSTCKKNRLEFNQAAESLSPNKTPSHP